MTVEPLRLATGEGKHTSVMRLCFNKALANPHWLPGHPLEAVQPVVQYVSSCQVTFEFQFLPYHF